MKNIRIHISLFILLVILSGCKKDNEIEFPEHETQLVIDGHIEQGQNAKVILTFTSPFFGTIDSTNIKDFIITGAKVTINNGTEEEILLLDKDNNFFPKYVYRTVSMKGEVGKKYKLTVNYQFKEYTAETTIPEPSFISGFEYETENKNDTLGLLSAKLWDIPDQENYYRIYTRRHNKSEIFVPSYNCGALSDEMLEKGTSNKIYIYKGVYDYKNPLEYIKHNIRDTLEIKLCTMDRTSFNCWRYIQKEILNYANPFAEGEFNTATNINGGIGVWAGYGVSKYIFYPKAK